MKKLENDKNPFYRITTNHLSRIAHRLSRITNRLQCPVINLVEPSVNSGIVV